MSRVALIASFQPRPPIPWRRPGRFRSRRFGRRVAFTTRAQRVRPSAIGNDLRLFAATFAGGFLFVSVLIV